VVKKASELHPARQMVVHVAEHRRGGERGAFDPCRYKPEWLDVEKEIDSTEALLQFVNARAWGVPQKSLDPVQLVFLGRNRNRTHLVCHPLEDTLEMNSLRPITTSMSGKHDLQGRTFEETTLRGRPIVVSPAVTVQGASRI